MANGRADGITPFTGTETWIGHDDRHDDADHDDRHDDAAAGNHETTGRSGNVNDTTDDDVDGDPDGGAITGGAEGPDPRHPAVTGAVTSAVTGMPAGHTEGTGTAPAAPTTLAPKPAPGRQRTGRPVPAPLFRTARQLAASTPAVVPWLAPGIVAAGALTELDGKAKSSGKTTFTSWLVRAMLTGAPFLNQPTVRSPVVWLTEQSAPSFRIALERARLLERDDLFVLCWADAQTFTWPEIVAKAARQAHRVGAGLLIVDTLPQFAGMPGDSENSAGAALDAIAPLQAVAAEGLAVLLTRHDRKSGGEVGESARGSTAFGGGVDIILHLSRLAGQARPAARRLRGIGRYDTIPGELMIALREGAGYEVLGEGQAATRTMAEDELGLALPSSAGEALSLEAVTQATGWSRTLTQNLLGDLIRRGAVGVIGNGTRGDPKRYYRLEERLDGATRDEEEEDAEPDLVSA